VPNEYYQSSVLLKNISLWDTTLESIQKMMYLEDGDTKCFRKFIISTRLYGVTFQGAVCLSSQLLNTTLTSGAQIPGTGLTGLVDDRW
jgi:hypothetical protein